jgi:deoxyribodipyrimidine photo-lyase
MRYLNSFLNERVENYSKHISKPELARKGCSRLSPYIAWGNLSIRQVYTAAWESRKKGTFKRQIDNFASRLRWQAHFIQKFEMESTMEFIAVNKGYRKLNQRRIQDLNATRSVIILIIKFSFLFQFSIISE